MNLSCRRLAPLALFVFLAGCSPQPAAYKVLADAAEAKDIAGLDAMLAKGHKIDEVDSQGYTALHIGATMGTMSVVEWAVSKGASINLKSTAGHSALHLALYNNNDDVAVWLINHGSDINQPALNGATPLDFATVYKCDKALKLLQSKGAKSMN